MAVDHQFYQAKTYCVDESVGYLANRLAQMMGRELDRRMLELGLTDAQWKPMVLLLQGRCATAADLARVATVDTGGITRLLDRLEAKGLIRRVRSAEDRRVVNLELTDEGRKVASKVPGIISQLSNQVLTGFSKEDFEQFKDLLNRALLNARQLGEGDAA